MTTLGSSIPIPESQFRLAFSFEKMSTSSSSVGLCSFYPKLRVYLFQFFPAFQQSFFHIDVML